MSNNFNVIQPQETFTVVKKLIQHAANANRLVFGPLGDCELFMWICRAFNFASFVQLVGS